MTHTNLRWAGLLTAALLMTLLIVNRSNRKYELETALSEHPKAVINDITALAWGPRNSQSASAKIPGLTPWERKLLNSAAQEQMRERTQHAKIVKKQEALLAKEEAQKLRQFETQKQMAEKIGKDLSRLVKSEEDPADVIKVLKSTTTSIGAIPKPLLVQEETVTKDARNQYDAFAKLKKFFHQEAISLENNKAKAIKGVQDFAKRGQAKILKDEEADIQKIKNTAQQRLTRIFSQESAEERVLRQKKLHAVEELIKEADDARGHPHMAAIFDKTERAGIAAEEKKQKLNQASQ